MNREYSVKKENYGIPGYTIFLYNTHDTLCKVIMKTARVGGWCGENNEEKRLAVSAEKLKTVVDILIKYDFNYQRVE